MRYLLGVEISKRAKMKLTFIRVFLILPAPNSVEMEASLINGVLNLTWFGDKTTNCISHYQIELLKDANQTKEFRSRVVPQHYEVPVEFCQNLFFSVSTVDVEGGKRYSSEVEIAVRGK